MAIAYDCSRASLYNPEHAETFFESGREHSQIQLAVEVARLAYFRAEQTPAELQRLSDALARGEFVEPARFLDVATRAASDLVTNGGRTMFLHTDTKDCHGR